MQRGNGQTPSQQSADIIQSVLAAAAASGLNQNPGNAASTQNQLQLIMAQQHQLVNPSVTINAQQPGTQMRTVQATPRRTGSFPGQGTPQASFIKVPISPSGSILEATSPVQSGQAPLILQHGRLLQLPQTVNMVTSSPQTIQTVQFQNTQGCISVPQLNTTMSIPVAITNQLATQKRPSGVSPGRSSNTRKSPSSTTGNPSHASHMPSHPSSKMLKMHVQLPDNPRSDDLLELRRCVLLRKERELKELKENYTENLIELFFLQKDGNMMDFVAYRKRPTPQLVSFLQAQALDGSGGVRRSSSDSHKSKSSSSDKISSSSGSSSSPKVTPAAVSTSTLSSSMSDGSRKRTVSQAGLEDHSNGKVDEPPKAKPKEESIVSVTAGLESRIAVTVDVPKPLLTTTPLAVNQSIPAENKHKKSISESTNASSQFTPRPTSLTSTSTPSPSTPSSQKTSTPVPMKTSKSVSGVRYTPGRQNSLGIGTQEKIVERAKQEAQVMQRIAQLRKEGLWAARRLPKVQAPPRHKTHWDYLLEEMQWLAADFAGERRWKKAASRKMARAVAKHHQELKSKMLKAERDEVTRMRKIASNIAKEIKQFWSNIEKVVQYKQQSRLDERRKKALDLQLDFIVGQTEKYSSWLTEGLNVSNAGSSIGSIPSSPTRPTAARDDGEFQPEGDESDDETTIRVEEEEAGANVESEENELQLLEKESQLPIQELLDSLPPEILQKPAELEQEESTKKSKEKDDDEFVLTDEEEETTSVVDDEETLEEQEDAEGSQDHKAELDELAAEGELPIEELMKKYAGVYDEEESEEKLDSDDEQQDDYDDDDSCTEDSEDESDEYDELEDLDDENEEDDAAAGKDGEAMDIEYLLNPDKENKQPTEESSSDSSPNNEITEFAAKAQSIQPTGYTLETTMVKTKVPFLLRHTLREYQHIGLDWLVTMHEKRLNGILADEMGLGKTIQTIAVLAHLACEEGIWGPHLIVVPTSVMLNWEMELKKWCPAFKILTYFGNQKERKLKRQGWTKCNAFHVCITSYQLVIQDHQAFRRKKWKYLILDEAQNIKNFKSQRWQTLLNFNSQRRLLLTGTPLQNSLMELWSLMHFLMPHVFQSHREFKEWFANPVTGMIEGNTDYNEGLIKRLHKVLRPFLLRRLKSEVEKQLPKKYEHIVNCRLSKRQRYLYEDFMSRTKTKETLASGQFLSVINVLMQLRKVCNHPDLFELRPIVSSFTMAGIVYRTAALVVKALEYDPFKHIKFESINLCLADHELNLPAYAAHRIKQLQTPRPLIEEIDSLPELPARPNKIKVKPGKLFSHIPSKETVSPSPAASTTVTTTSAGTISQATTAVQGRASPAVSHVLIKTASGTILQRAPVSSTPQGLVLAVSSQQLTSGSASVSTTTSSGVPPSITLVSQQAVPSTTQLQQLPGYTIPSGGGVLQQRLILQPQGGGRTQFLTHPITVQLQGQHGTRITLPASQIRQLPQGGIVQIVQTASGQQILRGVQLATTTQVGQSPTNPQLITTSRAGASQLQLLTQGLRTTAQSPRMTQLLITTSGVNSSGSHVIKSSTAAAQLLSAVNTVSSNKIQIGNLPASLRPVVRVSPLNTENLSAASTSILSKASLANSQTKAVTSSGLVLKVAPQPMPTQTSATSLILNHPSLNTNSVTTMSRKDPTPMAVVSPAIAIRQTSGALTSISSPNPKLEVKAISTTSDTITTKAASSSVATIVTSMTKPKTSTTILSRGRLRSTREKVAEPDPKKNPLYLESIVKQREECHKASLTRIADINRWRCGAKPVYGQDLCRAVSIINCLETPKQLKNIFSGVGYFTCHNTHNHPTPNHADVFFKTTKFLQETLQTPAVKMEALQPVFKRFLMTVSPAWGPGISIHTSPVNSSACIHHNYIQDVLMKEIIPRAKCLHALQCSRRIQFPELRLIQYDCGKLQTLDVLLRRLKPDGHRVLIFTQMTKMLDVLEKFLNFHGHTYLRLDGATKVEARQMLMERFNADKRIFCFILSTRSGGLGINLTGADTVVFYDSDWNPTMDAQAQDRCHRIGQTRDVHIYRLVSEMTVEENILKKAHQKRLLADVSIEGGNFTTAFFKKHALTELFEKPDELKTKSELVVAKVAANKPTEAAKEPTKPDEMNKEVASKTTEPESVVTTPKPDLSQLQLEQALAKAEDETDVQAASMAHAEQDAELAEFDEDIPFDGEERSGQKEEQSRVEMELAQLQDQLTPIEKYALTFLESTVVPLSDDQLNEAEEQVEIAKKEWELSHLQALKEEEERKAEMEEDEIFYTYTREDAYNKIYISQSNKIMPIWAPPTPPQDDNDVYCDHAMYVMYEPSVMTETQLPSIYTKKEHKKAKETNAVATVRKPKTHSKGDHMQPPRSLFDRPSSAWHKMRRDAKQQKMRDMVKPMKPLPTVHKPEIDTQQDRPEWLINEDWALLQAIQVLLELPLSLQVLVPGHTINWELVSDVVNSCSRIYRSPKQCKNRYESVIVPREEGKILYDTNPKKQKKSKGLYKSLTKNNRPMKTSHLHTQDNNSSHTMLYSNKFDQIRLAVSKRQPYLKQVLNNPLLKNPKHSAVLQDYSINYEKPLLPFQVAAKRADRIAKEKKEKEAQIKQTAAQNAAAAAASTAVKTTAVATAASATVLQAGTVARPGNSIVVNTQGGVVSVSGQQIANINKRLNQQPVTAANASQIATSIAQIVRTQGGRTTQVTIPTSALQATQARTTTASIMVSTVSGVTTVQARGTPTSSLATAAMVKATTSNLSTATLTPANLTTAFNAYKRQAQAQAQPTTIKQQFKQVDLKRIQQAQAQAKAAQAEAHAQAQASQQLVTAGGSSAAVVAGIVQQQRVQQKPATLTRPLKEAEISLIKRQLQQHKLNQSTNKIAVTTVGGVTVSGVVTVGQQKGQTLKQLTFTPQQLRSLQMQQLLRQKQQKIQTLTPAQAAQLTQKAQFLATQQQKLQAARLVAQVQQGSGTQHIQVTPAITTAQQLQQVQKAVQSGQVQVQQASGQTTVQQIQRQQLIQLGRTGGPSTSLAIQQTSKPITVISGPSATLNASQLAQVVSATNAQKLQSSGQTTTHVVAIAPPSGSSLQAQVVRAAGIQEAVSKAAQSIAITVPSANQSLAKMDVIMVEQHGATETVITEPPSPAESNDSKKDESEPSDTDPSTSTRPYAMRTRTQSKH